MDKFGLPCLFGCNHSHILFCVLFNKLVCPNLYLLLGVNISVQLIFYLSGPVVNIRKNKSSNLRDVNILKDVSFITTLSSIQFVLFYCLLKMYSVLLSLFGLLLPKLNTGGV